MMSSFTKLERMVQNTVVVLFFRVLRVDPFGFFTFFLSNLFASCLKAFLDWKSIVDQDDTTPETEIVQINFKDQAPVRKLSVESVSSTPSPTSM